MDVRAILRRNSSDNGQPKAEALSFAIFRMYITQVCSARLVQRRHRQRVITTRITSAACSSLQAWTLQNAPCHTMRGSLRGSFCVATASTPTPWPAFKSPHRHVPAASPTCSKCVWCCTNRFRHHSRQVAKSQRLAGQHAACLDTLAQAQRRFGERPALHAACALCHLATSNVAAALESLQAAHRMEQHEAIYTTLARLYGQAGKLQHSTAAYERALAICQADADVACAAASIEVVCVH